MTIEQDVNKSTVVLTLSGRLDAANAPLLERRIKQWGPEITELILDFEELTYISSVGLRVLLQTEKVFKKEKRKLIIRNMKKSVHDVFEMTGFLNLMVQEEQFIIIRKNVPEGIVLSFNGQMQSDNIAVLLKELSDIRENHISSEHPVTVILDMEKLTSISSHVCRLLKQTIDDTAWNTRKIKIRNVASDILWDMETEGMRDLLEK